MGAKSKKMETKKKNKNAKKKKVAFAAKAKIQIKKLSKIRKEERGRGPNNRKNGTGDWSEELLLGEEKKGGETR